MTISLGTLKVKRFTHLSRHLAHEVQYTLSGFNYKHIMF